ncbi:MAG: amidohydrolase family protein [Chloroflexi bacterium]|nr:amidohydrolase family protein [Chloroflexota bacterium]
MQADTVLYNGNIHTMDEQTPHAQAVALAGNRILALGDNDAMRALLAPNGQAVDLQGQTVVPGFTDAHIHFLGYGLSLREIDLMDVPTLQEAQQRIAAHAATTPAGHWLTGRGWDQSLWAGGTFPTWQDLDRVTPDHPAFLRRKCGHVGWANQRALALAGITTTTPDPAGGEIERDPHTGEPTGILKELAMDLVGHLLAQPTEAEALEVIKAAQVQAHKHGIVGIQLMGGDSLPALQTLRTNGELKLRVTYNIPVDQLDAAIQLGLRPGLGDEWLRIGAVKFFADGSLGGRTAQMIEPYENEPNNRGIEVTTREQIHELAMKAAHAGIPISVHAIGDQANRNVLDAIEATHKAGIGLNLRHRMEHAQILHVDDLPRFAQLGVIASMQPIHCTQDMRMATAHWGDRCRGAYAWRSLLDSGAKLAFGSDAPVEDLNVLKGLHAAVTRRRADGYPGPAGWYAEECLRMEEAVYAYTAGAAYAIGAEQTEGKIAPGMTADLVVLSEDIFSSNPMALLETEVVATMVGGEFVYTGEGF